MSLPVEDGRRDPIQTQRYRPRPARNRGSLHRRLSVALLCPLIATCASNPYYDPDKPHHTPSGFRNRYSDDMPGGLDFLRWQWQRWRAGLPKPPASPILPVRPELDFIRRNRTEIAITWIGHATVLLQMGGLNILTDPHFSERVSPLSFTGIGSKRHQPPGIALADLPHIDVVLISHNHYDHLDLPTVRALYRQRSGPPVFFVPLGIDQWFKARVTGGETAHLRPMDWWDEIVHRGIKVRFLPVQHSSWRTPWNRNATLWGAWAVTHPRFSFFFSGDLAYSKDLQDIGRALGGFDFAAITIGAYEPRWFFHTQHVNPQEAVRIHQDLGTRQSLGIHWGTFEGLTDEPLDQPPRDLAAAREAASLSPEEFFVLRHGETYRPGSERDPATGRRRPMYQ